VPAATPETAKRCPSPHRAPGQRPHFRPFFLPPLPPGLPAPAALPGPAGAPAGCLALSAGAAFFVRPGCRGTSSATLSNSTLPARAAAWPCQSSELGQPNSASAAPPVLLTVYVLGWPTAPSLSACFPRAQTRTVQSRQHTWARYLRLACLSYVSRLLPAPYSAPIQCALNKPWCSQSS